MCVDPQLSDRRRWRRKQHIRIHKQGSFRAPRSSAKDGREVAATKAAETDISTGLVDRYHDDGESLVDTVIGEPSDRVIVFSIPPDQARSVIVRRYNDVVSEDPLDGVSEEVLELVGESLQLGEFCPGALPTGFFLEDANSHRLTSKGADMVARRRLLQRELERAEA